MDEGCSECSVVGHCSRCDRIVCWGHHRNVEEMIALPAERLRELMAPQAHFTARCPI